MTDAGQIRAVVTKALGVWERNSKLTFREVYSDQADIQVLFARRDHGDGYNFDGPGLVLAHAFYPGVGRGGDAHFDAEETWDFSTSSTNSKGTNFLNVAVHEFGHSLGLGHSPDPNAVMFSWYKGQEVDGPLPDDDRLGIQELYGSKDKTWGPYKPRTTTTTMRPLRYYPEQRYPYNRPENNPRNPTHYQPHYHYPETQTTKPRTTTTKATQSPPYRPPMRPTQKPTKHYSTKVMKPRKLKPDNCMTTYDAISIIRGELFIFRGQFVWRINSQGLYAGYPTETRRHWDQLPTNFTKIDAVYENRDRKIIFFIGRMYYVFDSVILERGYPQPLTSLGLPPSLTHVDAAFIWGHNNRTYLCSGTLYWRMDDDMGRVEYDYPRDMSIWAGIGYNIDAAFQYTNRKTYFFKGLGYWEFDDDRMRVAHARPKLSARQWMNCPRRANEVDEEQTWTAPLLAERNQTLEQIDRSSSGSLNRATLFVALTALLLCCSTLLER